MYYPLTLFSFFFFLTTCLTSCFFFFFFNDTATTEIYTLSLHDALPISTERRCPQRTRAIPSHCSTRSPKQQQRSEEHTSELQSHSDLVCRLLLEKKKKKKHKPPTRENEN